MSVVVVKIGGHALDDRSPEAPSMVALADDIQTLRASGTQVVIVHGGGPQIDELLSAVGISSNFVEGLRVTPVPTMVYVDMALSSVNRELVATLTSQGVAAVGCSGIDGSLLRAESLGEPWGQVAGSPFVNATLLKVLLAGGFTPVVTPVAGDATGGRLNCNADTAAGAIAAALQADGLLMLSDIDQLRTDPDDAATGLATVSQAQATALLASGAARDGMRPKLTAAVQALEAGAQRVWLANGRIPHAVRDVLAGNRSTTEVVA